MRTQVTRKKLSENYNCIAVGYCDLQSLLSYSHSDYYTAGVYGWNFDAYTFEIDGMNLCITTGYRSMINNCKNSCTYGICKKYETLAHAICSDNKDKKNERMQKLIDEFLRIVFSPVLK